MTLLLSAAGDRAAADDRKLWEQVEPLLAAGVDDAREGDFQGAWSNMYRAFSLGGDSELVGLRRAAYCRREECPRMHDLARLLGKPRSALGFLAGVCPDLTDHRCRRWAASLADGARYLGDEAAVPADAQEVELRLWFAGNGDPRPWVVVGVGDEAVWAMVDTGGYKVYFQQDWLLDARADFRPVDRPFHARDSDGEYRRRADGVLRGFRIGTLKLPRVLANAIEQRHIGVWFGMNILLRYDAVCFSWPEQPSGAGTLYLGALGPCREAEAAERPFLHPRTGQPHLEVSVYDGTRLTLLVDTGAIGTNCKKRIETRYGQAPLDFGPHPALTADRCQANLYPVPAHRQYSVMIGMTTLLKFKAFGWQLDPFQMYFLPRGG